MFTALAFGSGSSVLLLGFEIFLYLKPVDEASVGDATRSCRGAPSATFSRAARRVSVEDGGSGALCILVLDGTSTVARFAEPFVLSVL